MTRLVLDTHVLIWFFYEPDVLRDGIKEMLEKADQVYGSVASLWEIAIKHAIGKLDYDPSEMLDHMDEANITLLNIRENHIRQYKTTRADLDHTDPFDVMLVSQVAADDLLLVTADQKIIASVPDKVVDARPR